MNGLLFYPARHLRRCLAVCHSSFYGQFVHGRQKPRMTDHDLQNVHVCRYFRRLQKRYAPNPTVKAALAEVNGQAQAEHEMQDSDSPSPSTDASLQLPVTCINLLRCSMQVSIKGYMLHRDVMHGSTPVCYGKCCQLSRLITLWILRLDAVT